MTEELNYVPEKISEAALGILGALNGFSVDESMKVLVEVRNSIERCSTINVSLLGKDIS